MEKIKKMVDEKTKEEAVRTAEELYKDSPEVFKEGSKKVVNSPLLLLKLQKILRSDAKALRLFAKAVSEGRRPDELSVEELATLSPQTKNKLDKLFNSF